MCVCVCVCVCALTCLCVCACVCVCLCVCVPWCSCVKHESTFTMLHQAGRQACKQNTLSVHICACLGARVWLCVLLHVCVRTHVHATQAAKRAREDHVWLVDFYCSRASG